MTAKLRLLFFLLILCFISYLYIKTGENTPKKPHTTPIISTKKTTTIDKIIATAKSCEGLPYKTGGTTKKGFDCSGLVMTSFSKQGVSLPRSSFEMAKKGKEVSLSEAKKGDLVFFTTNSKYPNKINHVGLVTSIENGTVYFIHSTNKKGVIISNANENYYKKTFAKVKRIL